MESGYVKLGLNSRLREALDAKRDAREIDWHTETRNGQLIYVIAPGPAWAHPKPPTLWLTPGEAADWCGIEGGKR